ncbi:unnamed protein product [Trypanosoma congolense IL3000]|uniref:WGS project CAEQ00000000 data, annotated contig 1179 n=1 Tax=Trypanosoma congolense (strain IL3000) TaxID=1068625 RepID=F9W4G8_TRYCI|nr:unnamed protein product [Trypanosoma congolense IL3000]
MKALSNSGLAALYIASGTVPASRLEPLARAALRRAKDMTLRAMSHLPSSEFEIVRAKLEQRVTVNSVISGVYIRCVRDIEELRQLLCDGTLSDSFSCFGSVGIVVVDSIAGTVSGGVLADGEVHGSAALVVGAVGALLKLFAIREGAAVLVTNQVRAVFPTTHQGAQRRQGLVPALGLQWAVAPHVRVNLRRVNNLSTAARRQLTIMSGPAHRPASGTYLICDEGIRNDE